MSDGVQLMLNEDGKAEIYDDTWDIVIHCETEKDFNEAREKILSMNWIPVTERLPEEDYCTGRGVQHSADVLVTIVNHADDDAFVNMAFTVDGKWQLTNPIDYDGDTDVPEWCEIIAWMPLPSPYKEKE